MNFRYLNLKFDDEGILVCWGHHPSGSPCEYERISPQETLKLIEDMRSEFFKEEQKVPEQNLLAESSVWLSIVGSEIHANKLRHGWKITGPEDWENQHEIPGVLALIHSEVSEALEAFRKDDKDNFAEELADVMIHTIGLAYGMKIDLGAAIVAKIEKNKNREYRHGGKRL